ncbi:MAG: hypothetical protein ACLGHN_13930 [Bacteriovoracia bacterium]
MTLSNFDWTDKDSLRWFILLPTGHEGPYSLQSLIQLKDQKKIAVDVKVWAEGLPEAVLLKDLLNAPLPATPEVEEVPELPPLPEEDIPPLPVPDLELEERTEIEEDSEEADEVEDEGEEALPGKSWALPMWAFFGLVIGLMILFAFGSLVKNHEKVDLARLPKMSPDLHERILSENPFDGWSKKIFFKEYLPHDHGRIWLVTSGFQKCEVEGSFQSVEGKLLTMSSEKVAFKSKGTLSGHFVEFSSFDFSEGSKIIPGLYEMDVKASKCEWDSFLARVMNFFSAPERNYVGRMKVVLFSKGATEFNNVLDKLIKRKLEMELKAENQKEIFWQDLQQKFETLQAITLQIEQHMLDYLDTDPKEIPKTLNPMVDQYTRKYGSFLTSFVVENENYFKSLPHVQEGDSQKRNYELLVKLTSKKIGFESMKFIEELQGLKKRPKKKDLESFRERVRKVFAGIKQDINEKLTQVNEDRVK